MDRPIEQLVPHAGRMLLLDRAIEADADSLVAMVLIRPDSVFSEAGGVGGWVGMEYMAQAVAAWAGWQARLRGEEPAVGYLVGTRRYECDMPRFEVGTQLRVTARREFQADNGLGQFECRIDIGEREVARATLTVFQPAQAQQPPTTPG